VGISYSISAPPIGYTWQDNSNLGLVAPLVNLTRLAHTVGGCYCSSTKHDWNLDEEIEFIFIAITRVFDL